MYHAQIITIYFQKRVDDFNTSKHNHKCAKEINLLSSRRFSRTFLNEISKFLKNILLKIKKIDKYGLYCHKKMVQPLVLRILRCSF